MRSCRRTIYGRRPVPDCESEFHVYACEWTESQIKMYIDDVLYFTFNDQGSWQKWPFDKRFHILLNTAVGGNWGGAEGVDNSAFPTKYIIDYIRVYAPGTKPTGVINADASDTIIGQSSFTILNDYNSITIYNDEVSEWFIR